MTKQKMEQDPAPSTQEWSNVPRDMDNEMMTPNPRELHLAGLAEKNKDVAPQRYDITSTNAKALRVVHDYNGRSVAIPPGETKRGVLLHPGAVEQLSGRDLELVKTST